MWSWVDIMLLKWSVLLIGMIAGGYLANFVKRYVWLLLAIAVILAVRPAIAYFENRQEPL